MLERRGSLVLAVICACTACPPLRQPPDSLLAAFTLNHTVPLEFYYVDDSNKGKGTHYKYSQSDINQLIREAERFIQQALSVLFGSTHPWYECLLLALGASHVTTVEYNKLTYSHPLITTTTPSLLETTSLFHTALSISSFDHDGLGRYGDPINPDGDLVAMDTVRNVLEENGLFFLTVPIGPDVLVWNLHRRYGYQRLPLLLCGWEEVESVGWEEELLTSPAPFTIQYEPVLILRHLAGCPFLP
ncbi:hypothetical protein GBAR_LOCUS25165 [Geodia barretti]|uniref:Uncharacterized protein n=1 Tax=Geodia barretti TaxID=519541 RepID=A0AA35TDB1_GEOBA|nr:hypothetical protein GBAR_LOCUS25165 [Geodia barretti]